MTCLPVCCQAGCRQVFVAQKITRARQEVKPDWSEGETSAGCGRRISVHDVLSILQCGIA